MRVVLGLCLALLGVGVAFAKPPSTIEKALADGWGLAGYVRGYDNRSSLMLFRRKDKTCLVQCAALHDATRSPRVAVNCYELR
jgi:hypothetical protein